MPVTPPPNPGGISRNWIHYLEKTIQGAMGSDAPVVFLQGACGDVTQVDNLSPYAYPPAEQSARFVGGRVGAEAVKVLLSVATGDIAPLSGVSRLLRIKRRQPSPERVRRAYELVRKDVKEVDVTEWTFAKEIVLLDALLAREPVADVEVQAVQVGPALFVTNPAEFFCQFGLDLKARSPFPFTFPVELANGCVGYVPTEEASASTGAVTKRASPVTAIWKSRRGGRWWTRGSNWLAECRLERHQSRRKPLRFVSRGLTETCPAQIG
jgi:hypothetical protein